MRSFSTAGPVIPEDHYHVPPLQRLNRDEVLELIQLKRYFVLHAPGSPARHRPCSRSSMN